MGEIKFPTKKQTVYLICGSMKDMRVETAPGYVIDLTNNLGYTTKVALLCKGKRWFATHFETGLDCTPNTKENGEVCYSWKRDDLINRLKDIDFKRAENHPFRQIFIDEIEKFKRGNK